jgi:hypothetical protein
VAGSEETFEMLLVFRLEGQGPRHPATMKTLHNLMYAGSDGVSRAAGEPAQLPRGVSPSGIRLDGEHVDREVDLVVDAAALQEQRIAEFGSHDPRTMLATSYLAYAMALADHIDGQAETAVLLARDAYEGLADAALESDTVSPHGLRIAGLILDWITELLDQSAD